MLYRYGWILLLGTFFCNAASAAPFTADLSNVGTEGSSGTIYALVSHDNGRTEGLTPPGYGYGGTIHNHVPEPATMTLMAIGLFFLSWRLKRQKHTNRSRTFGS